MALSVTVIVALPVRVFRHSHEHVAPHAPTRPPSVRLRGAPARRDGPLRRSRCVPVPGAGRSVPRPFVPAERPPAHRGSAPGRWLRFAPRRRARPPGAHAPARSRPYETRALLLAWTVRLGLRASAPLLRRQPSPRG